MSDSSQSGAAASRDTLAEIAARQRTKRPPVKFELTVRFINLLYRPPVGVRYELLIGKTTMAKGTIGLFDNEATLEVIDGANVTMMAQWIGQTGLRHVTTFAAKRAHPVVLARINSVKLPSATEAHPKTPVATPADYPPAKPAAQARPPANKDQGLPNQPTKNSKGAAEHQILPGECACGRELTIDELAAIFPSRTKADLAPYLAPLNKMMATYQIDSCLRKAHALAQIGHESGSMRYCAEVLPNGTTEQQKYEGYKGRGLIQITWKDKYQAYGKHKGIDFLGENRLKLETYEYATDSAGWYWNFGKPYRLSDYADLNDLIFISAAINAGFNGFEDRASIFTRTHRVLNAEKCTTEKNRSPKYPVFEKSKAYDIRDMAFAWALWSDPESKRKGLPKNRAVSKAAYCRFLALNETDPVMTRRFGFKPEAMIKHAEERSK
jgi:predicted chitinase